MPRKTPPKSPDPARKRSTRTAHPARHERPQESHPRQNPDRPIDSHPATGLLLPVAGQPPAWRSTRRTMPSRSCLRRQIPFPAAARIANRQSPNRRPQDRHQTAAQTGHWTRERLSRPSGQNRTAPNRYARHRRVNRWPRHIFRSAPSGLHLSMRPVRCRSSDARLAQALDTASRRKSAPQARHPTRAKAPAARPDREPDRKTVPFIPLHNVKQQRRPGQHVQPRHRAQTGPNPDTFQTRIAPGAPSPPPADMTCRISGAGYLVEPTGIEPVTSSLQS